MNLKLISLTVLVSVLTGCTLPLASIKVPERLSDQTTVKLTTDGNFWGLGMDGTFDLGGLYHGKYDRNASKSAYFGDLITNTEGSMAAEVINTTTQKRWILSCHGGGSSVNIGNVSFGGTSPYECTIKSPDNHQSGKVVISKDAGLVNFGPTGKVEGSIQLDGKTLEIESIHDMEGSFIPVDQPLGYYLISTGQIVAAIQVNGRITLQSDGSAMDMYAIATVASSLSIRPEE